MALKVCTEIVWPGANIEWTLPLVYALVLNKKSALHRVPFQLR